MFSDFLTAFPSAFLPLFIAIDAIGIMPIFMSLTEGYTDQQRRRLAMQATATALVVSLVIIFSGTALFGILGITLNDLRVSGGIILFVIAVSDLLFGEKKQRTVEDDETGAAPKRAADVGIVPLGIPLVCGPAAITTLIISQRAYGTTVTTASLVLNLAIVLVTFVLGPWLLLRLGRSTSLAIAKVVNLFLAAIAVAMIRAGIQGMIQGTP